MSIRKVLVTGAGGLMGGYVIDKLLGHYDLYGIDILPDKKGLPHIPVSYTHLTLPTKQPV